MLRYYVAYSHQSAGVFGTGSLDWNMSKPIMEMNDLTPIREYLARNGYRNIVILSFSLYLNEVSETTAQQR